MELPEHGGTRDLFAEHKRRMTEFRRAHAPLRNTADRESGEPREAESILLLPALQMFGYVLNLIRERGTILLPRNWQN